MSVFNTDFTHQISTKVLSQFCGARIDRYVTHVASVLCKDYKPAIQGERRVNAALNNLPVYFSPDDRLSFGWSLSHVLRNQAVHEGSYEQIGIMVALAESFHEKYAALILHEMAVAMAGPDDITPHLGQWVDTLRSCNGAFATVDFGVMVEDCIRLDPYSVVSFQHAHIRHMPIPAKQVADALRALSKVTSGQEKKVAFSGSPVMGWLAAVAQFLYDLRIVIMSDKGELLLESNPGTDPQVSFIYEKQLGIRISTKPLEIELSKLNIKSQQYHTSVHKTPFGGRVAWQSLLPRVFGSSFSYLDHEESRTFGTIVGSAARMLEGLALGEGTPEGSEDLISTQNKANPSSYGAGLVQTLTAWLPELRRVQGQMNRALKMTPKAAAEAYLENLSTLRKRCGCGICSSNVGDANEGKGPDHGYCLTVITETVIAMGLALSRTTVSSQIFPSRAGIQIIYAGQVAKRLEARGKVWQEHFSITYGNEWNAPNARRLLNCIAMFSGSQPEEDVPENLVAVAHEGMCAYFMKLEKSTNRPETESIIRVVSGGINVGQKVFRRACIGPVTGVRHSMMWERVEFDYLTYPRLNLMHTRHHACTSIT